MSIEQFIRKIVILVLVFLAFLFFLALASYYPDDVSILNQRVTAAYEAPQNLVGFVGASIAAVCYQLVGAATFVLVGLFGVVIYHYARRDEAALSRAQVVLKWAGSILFLLFGAPDIAITQVVVEIIVVWRIILWAGTLGLLGCDPASYDHDTTRNEQGLSGR